MNFIKQSGNYYHNIKIAIIAMILYGVLTGTGLSAIMISNPIIEGLEGKTRIVIPTSAETVSIGKLNALRNIIYVDIEDAQTRQPRMSESAIGGAVARVLVSQFQVQPTKKVRIVVHFAADITGAQALTASNITLEGRNIILTIDNVILGREPIADTPRPIVRPTPIHIPAPAPPPILVVPPLERPVTVTFSQTDLADVIRILSSKAGINIYAGPEVTGKITIQVQNEPVGEVLKNILAIHGFRIEEISDNAFRIVSDPALKPPPPPPPPPPVTKIFNIDYANASEIAATISQLLKVDSIHTLQSPDIIAGDAAASDSRTKIVAGAGRIIVTAPSDIMNQVEKLVEKLDQPIKQVMIDIRLVSMEIDSDKEFGFGWDMALSGSIEGASIGGTGYAPLPGPFFSPSGLIPDPLGRGLGGIGGVRNTDIGNLIFNIANDSWSVLGALRAMIEEERAELLANPKLIALNNTVSRFDLTEKIPYLEFQLDQLTNTLTGEVREKEAGIKLEITPQITSDGRILLRVVPDQLIRIGDVEFVTAADAPLTRVPIIDQRRTDVTVSLRNGQTLVIGGLRRKDEISTETKIPWLGDIPILGRLFRSDYTTDITSELVIFVTPHIIPDDHGLTTEEKMMYDRVDFF